MSVLCCSSSEFAPGCEGEAHGSICVSSHRPDVRTERERSLCALPKFLPHQSGLGGCTQMEPKILFYVGPYGVTEVLQRGTPCSSLFRAIRKDLLPSSPGGQGEKKKKNKNDTFLIKALLGAAARPSMHARLSREFSVLKELEKDHVEGVIRPVELFTTPEQDLVLVLQDDWHHHHQQQQHGHTLRQLITTGSAWRRKEKEKTKGIDLKQFFMIAIGIVEVLKRLHQRGLVHKNISPDSICVLLPPSNEEDKGDEEVKVQLLDFGICEEMHQRNSTRVPKTNYQKNTTLDVEEEEEKGAEEEEEKKTEGNWAYMAPEQTGRTKRVVDHRTDFYSLGTYTVHSCGNSLFQYAILTL